MKKIVNFKNVILTLQLDYSAFKLILAFCFCICRLYFDPNAIWVSWQGWWLKLCFLMHLELVSSQGLKAGGRLANVGKYPARWSHTVRKLPAIWLPQSKPLMSKPISKYSSQTPQFPLCVQSDCHWIHYS